MKDKPEGYCFSLSAPLNEHDTENQTYGCRHSNSDICGSCFLEGICAFVTEDHICKKPSKKWMKVYIEKMGTRI